MNNAHCPSKNDDEMKGSTILSEADRALLMHYLENPPDPIEAYDRIVKLIYLNEKGERIYEVDNVLLKESKIMREDPE